MPTFALRRAIRARRPSTALTPLLHILFLLAAATQTAIVPLLPRIGHVYGLSTFASGLLLAAPGLATLVVSLPAGLLADRLGAARLTIAAAALMAVAVAAQAAPSYPLLLLGRLVFGLAYGIVWTTGVAWLSAAETRGGSPKIGAVATSAALGMVLGPGVGGLMGDTLGLGAPFLIAGAFVALLAVALARSPRPAAAVTRDAAAPTVRMLVRLAADQPDVLTGAIVLAVTGAAGGVTQLLVPMGLHRIGLSASATGAAFSAAAGVYIVVSAAVVRLGRRATTRRWAAAAALVLALSLAPAAVLPGASILIGVLLVSTAPRAVVSTVSYPLATEGAAAADLGDGAVIGLLNLTWAGGLVLAPLLAGSVEQLTSPGPAFLTVILPGVLLALWLLARRPRAALARA